MEDFHDNDPLHPAVLKQNLFLIPNVLKHTVYILCMFSCLLSVRVNFANFEILKYIRLLLIIHNKKDGLCRRTDGEKMCWIVTPPRIAQINFIDLWYSDRGWEVRTSLWSHMWSAHGDSIQSVTDNQPNTMVRVHEAFSVFVC